MGFIIRQVRGYDSPASLILLKVRDLTYSCESPAIFRPRRS